MTLPIAPTVETPLPVEEIGRLAQRHRRAGGLLMSIVNSVGTRVEGRLSALPEPIRRRLDETIGGALLQSYHLAGRTLGTRDRLGEPGHRAAAALAGAAGGAAGLPSALAELPLTVTLTFRAIQSVAASHGFDPRDPAIRQQSLRTFTAGSPFGGDEGVETAFLGTRLALSGPALERLISALAPRLTTMLAQKLGSQSVPVIGAVAGAGVNWAFLSYYQDMAQVRFGLIRLADTHPPQALYAAFAAAAGLPARAQD